jgi:aldose 1-epimerase
MSAGVRLFGDVEGVPVHEVSLENGAGAKAAIIGWGAAVRDLQVPLPAGGLQRVVLGLETLEHYRQHSPYFGAIAGRYANRIGNGRFVLDGRVYDLDRNQAGKHTLHGGARGLGKRPWQLADHGRAHATFTVVTRDGDQGFPGTLTATCTYRLLEPGTLRVELSATSDSPTVCNLAHHSYFNLDGSPDTLDHEIEIPADFITPVDADLIPTGEILPVAGTPFDLRSLRPIRHPGGEGGKPFHYDHNYVLQGRRPSGAEPLHRAALVRSPKNGVTLVVETTEPGVQFYDGAKMAIPVPGLGGATYGANAGFCLEPQKFPDSPNKPHFPDPTLRPGEVYRQVTEYRFA